MSMNCWCNRPWKKIYQILSFWNFFEKLEFHLGKLLSCFFLCYRDYWKSQNIFFASTVLIFGFKNSHHLNLISWFASLHHVFLKNYLNTPWKLSMRYIFCFFLDIYDLIVRKLRQSELECQRITIFTPLWNIVILVPLILIEKSNVLRIKVFLHCEFILILLKVYTLSQSWFYSLTLIYLPLNHHKFVYQTGCQSSRGYCVFGKITFKCKSQRS